MPTTFAFALLTSAFAQRSAAGDRRTASANGVRDARQFHTVEGLHPAKSAEAPARANRLGRLRRRLLVASVGWIAHAAVTYLRWQRDREHLSQLPDYLLDDVGLTRDQVR